jgi:hypothetical protein
VNKGKRGGAGGASPLLGLLGDWLRGTQASRPCRHCYQPRHPDHVLTTGLDIISGVGSSRADAIGSAPILVHIAHLFGQYVPLQTLTPSV